MLDSNWGWRHQLGAAIVGLLLSLGVSAQDNLQERFDAATAAIEQDNLKTARVTLTELLDENPNLQRVRLELARVYYLSYDYDEAERLASIVLNDPNTPASVQTTVLAFLAQISQDKSRMDQRHIWSPSIYIGAMYDSNVNFGPSRDIIEIGGVPFVVLPESREISDGAWVFNPAITHTYNSGKRFDAGEDTGLFAWQSLAGLYYRGYFEEDDFNFGVLTLRTGPTWVVPGRWRASIGLQGDQIWLGGDDLAWFSSLNPIFGWNVSPNTELIFDVFLTNRDYSESSDSDRDGWFYSGFASVNHFLRPAAVTLQGGIGYRRFDADSDRFTYTGPEVFVGFVWSAWNGGSIFGQVGYRNFDFKGTEPGFNAARDDDEFRYSLGAQHQFLSGFLRDWVLIGNATYTDNQSDEVPIFEYDRLEINIGLSRFF